MAKRFGSLRAESLLALGVGLSLTLAGAAGAAPQEWDGTLSIVPGPFATYLSSPASFTGNRTTDVIRSGQHLQTLKIPYQSQLSGTVTSFLSTPTSGGLGGVTLSVNNGAQSFNTLPFVGTGTFAPFSTGPGLSMNTLPMSGLLRLCLFITTPPCPASNSFTLPFLYTNGTQFIGVGVGGPFPLTVGSVGPIRMSLFGAPWTVGTATGTSVTPSGMLTFPTLMGFVHGAASNTSSTATGSGVLQLVTPITIRTIGLPAPEKQTLFGTLTIHFVPEPGRFLLLGTGVVGLLLIAWRRGRS